MFEDAALAAATDRAFAALDAAGGTLEALGEVDRTLVIVTSAQGVIDNGGLRCFFENDWAGMPPYELFAAAYRRAGLGSVADAILSAAGLYPFPEPHRHERQRRAFHAEAEALGRAPFEAFDRVACGNAEVWPALARLVRSGAP